MRITDIDEFGRFAPDPAVSVDSPLSANFQLSEGEIVVARTGASVGKSYRYIPPDGPLVFAGFLIAVVPDSTLLDPRYLSYYFQSKPYWNWITSESMRSGQPGINARQLALMPIDAPSVEQQRDIANRLQDVDDLIVSIEHLIAKKRALKQGMLQELLTGRTRLPGFGSRWELVRLGDHVTFVQSVALSRAQLDRSSPLRYLHYGDIHTRASATLDAASEEMPRASAGLAGGAGRLQVGDLVFADASEDTAGVGKSVEITGVPADGLVPGLHTIAARFDKRILANGFKAYLQHHPTFRAALLRLASGTKVLATTKRFIAGIELELPPPNEQEAIARSLGDADAEIDALERRLEAARDVKQGMMQELLTGRTRLSVEGDAA